MRRAPGTHMSADRQLIALVRRRPALYDVEDPQYQDTVHKAALWHEIAQEIGMDAKLCRSRWFNMRDQHRKSLIRSQVKRRAGKPTRVYKYARDMTFLKKFFSNLAPDEDQDGDEANDVDNDGAAESATRCESPRSLLELTLPAPDPFPHPVDAFLACIEPTLKALPPYLLSLAKGEIFAAVQKYELRMLNPLESKFDPDDGSDLSDQK